MNTLGSFMSKRCDEFNSIVSGVRLLYSIESISSPPCTWHVRRIGSCDDVFVFEVSHADLTKENAKHLLAAMVDYTLKHVPGARTR